MGGSVIELSASEDGRNNRRLREEWEAATRLANGSSHPRLGSGLGLPLLGILRREISLRLAKQQPVTNDTVMHTDRLPTFAGATWLLDLVTHATGVGACMNWGCTTCGALPFRRAVTESANLAAGPGATEHQVSVEIATQLGTFPASASWVPAIRFLLMFLYAERGKLEFERDLLPLIASSPAESEYQAMAAHYARVVERRRLHEAANDPEEIARRKTLKETEKQERLAMRAIRKAEIDRAWRERVNSSSRSRKQ